MNSIILNSRIYYDTFSKINVNQQKNILNVEEPKVVKYLDQIMSQFAMFKKAVNSEDGIFI